MIGELGLRFVLGGAMVSLFAACGEVLKPKTLAGMFGVAPSVAIATLGLAFGKDGASYAADECRSMMIGSVALLAYSALCVYFARKEKVPIWLGASLSWLVWFATAFTAYFITTQTLG